MLQELDACQQQPGVLAEPLQKASKETLVKAAAAAKAAVDTLMLTDAPLLYPPGQLALAAVRSGLQQVPITVM